jgi:hypothetical protein
MDAIRCKFCGEMFSYFPNGETAVLVAASTCLTPASMLPMRRRPMHCSR